jgi:hypothetical protein
MDMETKRRLAKGSPTLTELARRLGVKVENPVGFDPQTGRFYTAQDRARERSAIDAAHLSWLLDLGQREDSSLIPTDEAMLPSFLWPYATTEPKPASDQMHKLASETVADIRRWLIEHTPLELALPNVRCLVEWTGPHTIASFRTPDWEAAFQLSALQLVAEQGERVRSCKCDDCGRLFVAADKRQVFCSRGCSQRTQFERYVEKQGGKDEWHKQRREQYHQRKKESGNPRENVEIVGKR